MKGLNNWQCTMQDKGLRLTNNDQEHYFNYYWLRDNCPSSFDQQTQERIFDIAALDLPPVAQAVKINDNILQITWQDLHISQFTLDILLSWANSNQRPDPADLPRQHWLGDFYPCMARFSAEQVHTDSHAREAWAKAMIEEGVALITGMPDTDQSLPELAQLLGLIRPSVAGHVFEVRVEPNPVNLSFTSAALEMHTDTPAEEHAPGIQFLHCRANSVDGGDSLFLDGAAVATAMQEKYPADFALLTQHRVPFYYDHEQFDWRSHQKVIELDQHGAVSGVTVSQHMADWFDLPQHLLDDYYPAFVRFLRELRLPEYLCRFRLNAGECIVFDNHRIVHGRDAYASDAGHRHLRGCYIDRGELRSSYRTLVRKNAQL